MHSLTLCTWDILNGQMLKELKVKQSARTLAHMSCWLQSEARSRGSPDSLRSSLYHISSHVVIIHLIALAIKLAQRCQMAWIQFSVLFPLFFSPLAWLCFFIFICLSSSSFLLLLSSLLCLSRAALIKRGVGVGTESSSRAEEKGSNSSSQDGALTHNGPAILSAPHRFPTESPLLRQLFNRPPLTPHTLPRAYKHTCRSARKTHVHLSNTHPHAHKPSAPRVCVSQVLQLTLLWAFWSAPKARRQPFHFPHHAEAQPLRRAHYSTELLLWGQHSRADCRGLKVLAIFSTWCRF